MITNQNQLYNNYEFQKVIDKRNQESELWKWIVLLGCFLIQMIPYCVAVNLISVFSSSDWIKWVQGNTSLIGLTYTFSSIVSAILGPFIATLFNKKINFRLLFSIGVVLSMVGLMGCSINSIIPAISKKPLPVPAATAILWIFNTFRQLGFLIFSTYGINNLISKWWPPEKRGFVLGVAFAGGSLGNIWMQQLMHVLVDRFGNKLTLIIEHGHEKTFYNWEGAQYSTYLIMGTIGIVGGLIAVLIACKKPIPPLDILNASANTKTEVISIESNSVSPLVTKKYPPYWILCFGLFFLQMGAIHSQFNSIFISQTLEEVFPNFGGGQSAVISLCGTLLGVSCLFGNTFGGFLNDKLGPCKSVLFAGLLQFAAITCLMMSINEPELIYYYYCLIGLSVYLFTSTNAFLCGRLFGAEQATSHLAIIGIFTAFGFALASPIASLIIGNTETQTSILLTKKVHGNWMLFFIYLYIAMGIGIILISYSCYIISSRGIKGLKQYSPTKYSQVIWLKHHVSLKILSNLILLTDKDYRVDNEKRIQKINFKKAKDEYYQCFNEYQELIKSNLKQDKLSLDEINILSTILFFNKILKNRVAEFLKINNIDKAIDNLLKKQLIDKHEIFKTTFYYSVSNKLDDRLHFEIQQLSNKYKKINQEILRVESLIQKEENKLAKKIIKINRKLEDVKNETIDENKKQILINQINHQVDVLIDKRTTKMDKINQIKDYDEWNKFKIDYELSSRIVHEKEKEFELERTKENKINQLNKKLVSSKFIKNYNIRHIIEGNFLLLSYYNDKYLAYDNLINEKIELKLHNQELLLNSNKIKIQYKLSKVQNKHDSFNNR